MKAVIALIMLITANAAFADDRFSSHLFVKFQAKACITCHDFFEKGRGIGEGSHKGRTPEMCASCHTKGITGFKHPDEWFAMPGLYTSGMDAKQTCEAVKKAEHAEFKSSSLLARRMETHLFEDPRVLWGIEGATPKSGSMPNGKMETGLVGGGLQLWKDQVKAWINGGMKCE